MCEDSGSLTSAARWPLRNPPSQAATSNALATKPTTYRRHRLRRGASLTREAAGAVTYFGWQEYISRARSLVGHPGRCRLWVFWDRTGNPVEYTVAGE